MLPYILSFLYKDVKTNRHFCTKKKQSSAKKDRSEERSFWVASKKSYFLAAFLRSQVETHREAEMSPVTFRQVRPMSNRRSTP